MVDGITPFGRGRDPRPRAMFFAHDSFGLGHIRRVLALTDELARRRPDAAVLIVTSSFLGGSWQTPEHVDLIKLPSLSRAAVYADPARPAPGVARRGRDRHTTFYDLREQLIRQVARAFDPWLFVADSEPIGLPQRGELLPTLRDLRAGPAPAHRIAGLRDICDSPAWVRTAWPRQGIVRALEEEYERILVYGDRRIFDVVAEYGWPPVIAEKITYTGYIRKREPLTPAAELRAAIGAEERPLIVVATGSGYDGATRTRAYLQALAEGLLPDVASFVVAGPLMAERERRALAALGHLPATRVVAFEERLTSWIAAADLVIGMAGYNTVTEALGYGRRLVLIPRIDPGEQLVRATRLTEFGLARLLHPDALTPSRLAREVRAALAAAPPAIDLDFGGLERAGAILAAALGEPAD